MSLDNQQIIQLFRHSAPYIHAHRGNTFVIMLGGDAIAHENLPSTIHDIALLHSLGIKLVLVAGARPQINTLCNNSDIDSQYIDDLRITDLATMNCVKQAAGVIRADIESLLSCSLLNSPMHGANIRVVSGNFITAQPIGIKDGVDLHYTGDIRRIDTHGIKTALDDNAIVLLTCLGYSPTGEAFNLAADVVAAETAVALKADKLVLFSDRPGITDNNNQLLREINQPQAELKSHLLDQAWQAVNQQVNRAHIISYIEDGSLLTELFTSNGSGTLVSTTPFEIIRAATIEDASGIIELISPLENNGSLVKRSRDLLENEITQFSVIERDGCIIGCAALYPYQNTTGGKNLAELACVAINPDYRGQQRGNRLLSFIEAQANKLDIDELFVLTTQTAHWFIERGFIESNTSALPMEKQSLYNYQRNSKIFTKPTQ